MSVLSKLAKLASVGGAVFGSIAGTLLLRRMVSDVVMVLALIILSIILGLGFFLVLLFTLYLSLMNMGFIAHEAMLIVAAVTLTLTVGAAALTFCKIKHLKHFSLGRMHKPSSPKISLSYYVDRFWQGYNTASERRKK